MSRWTAPEYYSDREVRDFNWFIATTKGTAPYTVARALNRVSAGCDWRGMGRRDMATAFARRNAINSALGCFLKSVDRRTIVRALKAVA